MKSQERLQLLTALEKLSHRESENTVELEKVFLPLPSHALALRPEIVIIRGGRGAGKSALFRLLSAVDGPKQLRRLINDDRIPDAKWIEAFSQSHQHPDVTPLDQYGKEASSEALRTFWMTHLLLRINEELPTLVPVPEQVRNAWTQHRTDLQSWVPVAQAHLGQVSQALDQAERALSLKKQLIFATYDHLDRIGSFDPSVRRRFVGALLALWLSYSNRYRQLRAKIFLRDDLLDAGELGFPDASKLRARSVSIEWDVESLYRAVVRHMSQDEELHTWLGRLATGRHAVELTRHGEFGWYPGPMPESTQHRFATLLAGEVMGTGTKKGYTYRWIPNHLQDAQGRIVPRSMLCLIGFAGREAAKHPLGNGVRLITPQDLLESLQETSSTRVGEIKEEYELVVRLENLKGRRLLLNPDEVIEDVSQPVPNEKPGLSTDGRAVVDELVRLGVISIRSDGRIDVPDIYRYGFGILRKGGAARAR